MDTRVFCVYNLARRVFLSSKVTVADGASQPLTVLKMLVSSVGTDAESGLWLSPLNGTPALARIFPYDLAYLDKDHRVLEIIEVHPGIDFPPYRREVTSAVVLPQKHPPIHTDAAGRPVGGASAAGIRCDPLRRR